MAGDAEIPINIVEIINTYIIDNNIMYIDPKKLRYVLTVMAQAINQGDASAVDAVLPLLFDSFTNQFSIQQASATTDGYITKEDWLAFSTPYASNIQDGQQLDFPYVDTNTFETPPGYIVVSVFTNIALQKHARYTRTSDSVIILDDLQVGDVVSVCGILATGTFILGGFDHFKGVFPTLTALNLALPTANAGDYAQVNEVGSTKVVNYSWDTEDNEWIEGGSGGSGASNTDMLPEGISNLYFTMARVLATVLTGVSFVTGGSIVSTDSVLVAFGKLQKQINDILTALDLKAPKNNPTLTGSVVIPNAVNPNEPMALGQYTAVVQSTSFVIALSSDTVLAPTHNQKTIFFDTAVSQKLTVDPATQTYQDGFAAAIMASGATNTPLDLNAHTGYTYSINGATAIASGNAFIEKGGTCTIIRKANLNIIQINGSVI